jgi:hypothetical protein
MKITLQLGLSEKLLWSNVIPIPMIIGKRSFPDMSGLPMTLFVQPDYRLAPLRRVYGPGMGERGY